MAQARLSWTLPDMRENGQPLPVGEIAGVELRMSADAGGTFSAPVMISANEPMPYVIDGLVAGNYLFEAVVVDTAGRRSSPPDRVAGSVLAPPNGLAAFALQIVE